jgi:tRNA(Arg) A34 adenosine deaminase TadA
MTEEDFIREAIEEARLAKAAGEWPFGAVIVHEGKIIARAACTEEGTKNVLGHAELQAINSACLALARNNLSDCAIYGTNEPCLMCASAIFQAKIPRVTFALARSDLPHLLRERKLRIEDLTSDIGYEVKITKGVLRDEARALFADIKKRTPITQT